MLIRPLKQEHSPGQSRRGWPAWHLLLKTFTSLFLDVMQKKFLDSGTWYQVEPQVPAQEATFFPRFQGSGRGCWVCNGSEYQEQSPNESDSIRKPEL